VSSKRKTKRLKKNPASQRQAESFFPLTIIFLNFLAFGFTHYWPEARQYLSSIILSPVNLLQGKLWCLLTSGFIHRNWSHLLLNMAGVFIFGRIVERQFGFLKTLFVYLGALAISMLFATVVYAAVLHKSVAIIGASGAVMGLMATAMLTEPFCITYEMILPIPGMVKGWMFLYADLKGFLGGETDGISHLAHLFGFLSIAVLVYFLSQEDKKTLSMGLMVNLISFMGFLYLRKWITTGTF
jgi:membrane associated rhomboid family serine protease